jgi:hypothetical protein
MKRLIVFTVILASGMYANAQEVAPAEKGVTYGAGTTATGAVPVNQIEPNMKAAKFTGKVTGKVVAVCQEKGCWMKIEKKAGETMMVKFKDYGFFMPKNIAGKEVIVDGEATVREIPVKQLKHYAADAGKSKQEISKITAPKKELIFVAKGVLVL